MPTFLYELKRRNVFRVAVVYLAAAWLLAQIVDLLGDRFDWPDGAVRFFLLALALLFPIALISAWLFEVTPEGVKRTSEVDPAASIRASTGRKLDRLLIGVLGALVVMLLVDRLFFASSEKSPAAQTAAETPASPTNQPSLAVLPFDDLSENQDQEYFADGITEEILNSLDDVSGLQVTGRTSSFYFKGRNENPRVIGDTLGVEYLLTGSVRKAGDQLRISAQLDNAGTGYQLWSQRYDRPLDDVFAIQEDIARSVSRALEVTLGVGDLATPGMTRNIEAYDAYLAGIALQARGTPESYLRATERFREAVALDPAFALAWLLLSGSLGGHAALTGGLIPPEAFVALMRAESLNPNDPRAKLLRAGLAIEAFEWRDIAREIQSLRETNPDEWYLDMFEGDFLRLVGRFDAAVVLYERAAIREPLDVGTADSVYEARYLAGDTAAATAAEKAAALRRAQGLPAPLTHDFRVAVQQRDVQRVQASIDSIIETDFTKLRLAAAMKPLLHDAAAAQAELRRLEPAADNVVDLSAIAVWWVYFSGDTDFVFDILARIDSFTSIGRGRALPGLIWNRTMSDLRQTPRFKELAREIGLVDYWREFGWADNCRPIGTDDFECS